MQQVVAGCWATEKPPVHAHIGDLPWRRYQQAGREAEWRTHLWFDADGEPAGWAWMLLPDDSELMALPGCRAALIAEMVEWPAGEAAAAGAPRLLVTALKQDTLTMDALLAAGLSPTDDQPSLVIMRSLGGDLTEAPLPHGYLARHVAGERDLARRVAVHRAAWSVRKPSRVTQESYRNMMAAWPYRPELDWVIEGPDGGFVASCLAWLDPDNAVGELEPVGTDPAYWRRGLGLAVCVAALRALRRHGADTAVVYATEIDGMPSAPALYRKLGFQVAGRHVTLGLTV
jgi:ribosomal protein S18 acetylase RimI-like enzyme